MFKRLLNWVRPRQRPLQEDRSDTFPDVMGFVAGVKAALKCDGDIEEHGVSRILHTERQERRVDVACNGSRVLVTADIDWPTLKTSDRVYYAPDGGYHRAKLLEEGQASVPTGDPEFDRTFVVLTAPGDGVPQLLVPATRSLLLAAGEALRPDLQGFQFQYSPTPEFVRRVHICANLNLRDPAYQRPDYWHEPRLGDERFTPEYVAEAADRVALLAREIEAQRALAEGRLTMQ